MSGMAGGTDEQREWVRRVLGIDFGIEAEEDEDDTDEPDLADDDFEAEELEEVSVGPHKPSLSVPKQSLLPIWIAAKEDLDGDIDKLQRALRDDGDEGLLRIAEYGLHKVTDVNSVRLMVALREADSVKSSEAVAKAYDAVQAFRSFLASSSGVEIIEDNPVDVDVPVRKKLGTALEQLAGAMEG
jgi:hypothetical protein